MVKKFRQQHRPKKSSLVIGRQAVIEAIQSGKQLDRIYLQNTAHGPQVEAIRELALQSNIPINKVPVEKLNGFNIADHEGIVAQLAKVRYYDLQETVSFVVEKGEVPLFLILDGITDIRNIGGIARTAFCCGVHALIIPDKGIGALNEEAINASAGALEEISVCRVNSLMKAVDLLHLNGIKVYAANAVADKNIFESDQTIPVAIVMGSEENGIYPALEKICDETVKIPMSGDFDSLNVGVAAGMILYEVMKQRIGGK